MYIFNLTQSTNKTPYTNAQWVKNLFAMQEIQETWVRSVTDSGRSPGGGNGNLFQYSYLEKPMDRGTWWATYSPWGLKELDTTE